MEYKVRSYPLFSACGLNCGLCPRYHTKGQSRCPGCAGEGFSEAHPACGILSCAQRRGLEYCFLCVEFPCKKYDNADLYDSFISHKNQFRDMEKAKEVGMDAYEAELNEKVDIVHKLLNSYDDGRKKSFYCTALNLLDLRDIKTVMEQVDSEIAPEASQKEKAAAAARIFEEMAEMREVSLKLRKK